MRKLRHCYNKVSFTGGQGTKSCIMKKNHASGTRRRGWMCYYQCGVTYSFWHNTVFRLFDKILAVVSNKTQCNRALRDHGEFSIYIL